MLWRIAVFNIPWRLIIPPSYPIFIAHPHQRLKKYQSTNSEPFSGKSPLYRTRIKYGEEVYEGRVDTVSLHILRNKGLMDLVKCIKKMDLYSWECLKRATPLEKASTSSLMALISKEKYKTI